MSLFTASLASGSNGNCYYISNGQEAVLIDAGISCKETEKRMRTLSLSMQKVKAIFISHEHIDHIKGAELLSKRYQLPVYITPGTLAYSRLRLESHLIQSFSAYEPVQIGGLAVTAFPKKHDAADPHSFVVDGNEVTVGVFTDIGEPCEHVIRHFPKCHAVFLETNYDEQMLENGRYPYHLKKRISGAAGHLSNNQALQLYLDHRTEKLQYLFLSHLSKDNNCPELAHDLFTIHSDLTKVIVASRYEATAVYTVNNNEKQSMQSIPAMIQSTLF